MPKFCTQCGMPLEEGQKFCRKCGAAVRNAAGTENVKFPEDPEINSVGIAEETPKEQKAENTAAIAAVPAAETAEKPTVPQKKEEKKESKKMPVWLIVVLLAAALGIGALFGSSLSKNSSSSSPAAATDESDIQSSEADTELDNAEEPVYVAFTDAGVGLTEGVTYKSMEEILVNSFVNSLDFSEQPIGYVKVKTARIRFRKGPSTSSTDTKKRTAVGDVYDVYEKTTGEGYNWYRVSKDEWIADNAGKWMTFTAYKYHADEYTDAQYAARFWKEAYDSYLLSINKDGDFHGYLDKSTMSLKDEFINRYSLYHKDFEIENESFEFDMTDYNVQDLGSGNYLCTCYAWITNSLYNKVSGQSTEHSFGVRAILAYSPAYEDMLLVSQEFDSNYSPEGHTMLSIND